MKLFQRLFRIVAVCTVITGCASDGNREEVLQLYKVLGVAKLQIGSENTEMLRELAIADAKHKAMDLWRARSSGAGL